MKKTEKYKIVYVRHTGEKDTMDFDTLQEVTKYKNFLLKTYNFKTIQVYHYDLVNDIGNPRKVFDGVNLPDFADIFEMEHGKDA